MIDANRLSHSLATALKDRPHGIPVQPNRSLPLRPPPPPPARISVSKSPKSSPLTPPTTPEIQKGKRLSFDGDSTKEGNLRADNDLQLPSLGVVGMNFYDSKEKDDDSRRKTSDQSRNSKSLDHEEFDETRNSGDNRRKSFDSEIISREKKRKSSISLEETPPKEKKRRGSYAKKRKLSNDDNSDGSRKEKSSKVQKVAPKSKANNCNAVESSGIGLPTIIRSRKTIYTPIRPKLPPGVPECPVAIPIEVAQAINLNGSTSPKNNAQTNGTDATLKPRIPKIRIIQNGRRFSQQIEDVENTLPSMPSLDLDSQNDILNGKNAARQLVPNREAQVSRVAEDLSSQTIQGDLNSIEDKIDQTCSDLLATNQTMIQISILSCSQEGIVMTLPKIIANGNVDSAIEPSTSPETISTSIQNGEQMTNSDAASIGQNCVLQSENATVDFSDTSEDESESELSSEEDESSDDETDEMRKKSPKVRSKVDLEKVKYRIQKTLRKLRRRYKEEEHLKLKMEQTNDPSRLTRLQQRKNLNDKRIENYIKHLDTYNSVETLSISENPPQLRIQVRQDLVDTTSTENVEPVRRSPFVPCIETDEDPVANSPRVSYPPVITISDNETDSESSDEEGYVIDERISENVKPDPDVGIESKHVPTNDSTLSSKDDYQANYSRDVKFQPETLIHDSIPLIDDLVPSIKESEMTNNNVEYMDKNLGRIEAAKSLPPLIPDPMNRDQIINYSSRVEQKSPNVEYRTQNINSAIERFDKDELTKVAEMKRFDGVNPNCKCSHCFQGSTSVSVQNQSQDSSKDANKYIPIPVILNQTINQENMNSQPVTNYPSHQTDYRAQGNATSMFSRDNGGANINLSSPLQGHYPTPGLSLPPYSQRNLTAQGYPVPGEHSPNYQTTQQWFNQQPGTKLPAAFTPDQDGATHPSILASHLLKPKAQEPSNVSRPTTNKPTLIANQFPLFSEWAAEITRDPTPRKKSPQPVINQNTGSDMYKMTASAVDARHPAAGTAVSLHWQQTRSWTEQQRPPPAYPAQRNNPSLYRPNYQQANSQNAQNSYIPTPRPQRAVYVQYPPNSYHPNTSVPQNNRNSEYSAAVPQKKQSPYYPIASSIQQPVPVSYQNQGQVNTGHPINSLAMMQNNYIPQAQYTSQGAIQQWMVASNYPRQQYLNSQYNGYGTQAKPTNNSTRYAPARQVSKNSAPVIVARETGQRRDGYVDRVIQPNRVVQDGLNEPLDLGRTSTIPQSVTSRLNNTKCSLCGTNDPKFHCMKCGAAFYCNRNCQAQHWRTHLLECSTTMPKLKKVS